ncbi:unnamed protein product [Caenorhabditis bovis]|uniref:Phospholipid scramblase n=1 Tax=Caenorhabditis bovis TaxID=2654633 RepID=A0A8S1EVJ3_9PELO|nr:unnamed protein product [Caenorhabditis bovis]
MLQELITIQPGASAPPEESQRLSCSTISEPSLVQIPQSIPGVPTGLEYLTFLDTLIIHQTTVSVCTDFDNKYILTNRHGQRAYTAIEESRRCQRLCLGSRRGFTMHILDTFGREVLRVRHASDFCSVLFTSIYTIELPNGHLLGVIRKRSPRKSVKTEILDENGRVAYLVRTPTGIWIGTITKKWLGFGRETFTDNFTFEVACKLGLEAKNTQKLAFFQFRVIST